MNCEFCGGTTVGKKVRKQHWLHKKLFIVENVLAKIDDLAVKKDGSNEASV